jgi:cholesterol transport system auxiliary component
MDVISNCQGRGSDAMRLSVCRIAGLLVSAGLVCGCSVLPKPEPVAMDQYVLEYMPGQSAVAAADDIPVLVVTTPRAHGGYDTHRIAYMKQEFGLRYYTRSRWADTPARMLAPLMAEAMNASGHFRALYASPGRVSAGLRLDTELIRFHQDFTVQPDVLHLTIRAQLVDLEQQQVLATQLFDIREPAESADAYGGVQAANRAVQVLLGQLTEFCAGAVR